LENQGNQTGDNCLLLSLLRERVVGKVKSSTLAYLGSIAAKPSASRRAVFWETVTTKLLALELNREDRVRIEALIAQRVQRGLSLSFTPPAKGFAAISPVSLYCLSNFE
jgi:hypothetical protein